METKKCSSGTPKDPEIAFKMIKDDSILLSIANEYLCDPPFLKKIRANMAANVPAIRSYIEGLQRQFVGKPAEELSLEGHLQELSRITEILQEGGKQTSAKCAEGELGKELSAKLHALTEGIGALKEKIEGSSVSYTAKDVAKDMIGKVTVVSRPIAATGRFLFRFVSICLLACLSIFVVLFVTMEREEGLVKEIEAIRQEIQKREASVPRLQEELQSLQAQIDSISEDDQGRKDEIAFVELNMKAHEVAEKLERAQIEVEQQQKKLDQDLIRLEEMRSKSLLQRL